MNHQTIAEIKAQLEAAETVDNDWLELLKQDDRKGVQSLLKTYENRRLKYEQLNKQYDEMSWYENIQLNKGNRLIAGVDEAGRGPLSGPVVAAAVILPNDFRLLGLNDSKQLNVSTRNEFYNIIINGAVSYDIAVVDNETIDNINIHEATKQAMMEAINHLDPAPDHILIDSVSLKHLHCSSQPLDKGDCKSVTIAAASILAKVTRDRIMQQISEIYPDYQFHTNKGYGTRHHLDVLAKKGATPYHRQSFRPVSG